MDQGQSKFVLAAAINPPAAGSFCRQPCGQIRLNPSESGLKSKKIPPFQYPTLSAFRTPSLPSKIKNYQTNPFVILDLALSINRVRQMNDDSPRKTNPSASAAEVGPRVHWMLVVGCSMLDVPRIPDRLSSSHASSDLGPLARRTVRDGRCARYDLRSAFRLSRSAFNSLGLCPRFPLSSPNRCRVFLSKRTGAR